MKRVWAMAFIPWALVAATLVSAQQPTPVKEICKGAQAWYDSIDGAEIANFAEVALDPKAEKLEQVKASSGVYNFADRLAEVKLPDCLKAAQKIYVKGLKGLSAALAGAMPPYFADQQEVYPFELAYSQRMIGEFRGYMQALGVQLEHPEDPLTDESYILTYK